MKNPYRLIAVGLVLLFAALACSLSPTGEPTGPSQSELETAVAQTLTAIGGGDDGGGDGGEEPGPTDTPAPPDSPAPPDLHVVYVDDGDLWLWTEAGGALELYSGETVEKVIISPDAEVIAFTTVDSNYLVLGLWRIYTDGSGLQRLVSQADFESIATHEDALSSAPYLWQFIPGTHTLAFNTRLMFEGPGLAIQDDLRHLDLDSGALSTFLAVGEAGNFYYSPDGSQIVLTTPVSVDLIDADGSNRQDDVITFPFVNTASEFAFYPVPRWVPDGSEFWVIIPPADPFSPGVVYELYRVASDGTPTSLGTYPGGFSHFDSGEMIAPDGSAVAYFESTGSGFDLFIAEIGGPDHPYDTGVGGFKGWSPDATHFVYGSNVGETWVGQIGEAPFLLDGAASVGDVIWLEDGRYVYANGTYGSFSLRLGTLGGGSVLIASPVADFLIFDAVP